MAAARASQVLTASHLFTRPHILAAVRFMGAKDASTAVRRRAFSTSKNTGSNVGPGTTEEEIPASSLKHLGANRRTRVWVAAGLLTVGFLEGATWHKFWPKITGRGQRESSN